MKKRMRMGRRGCRRVERMVEEEIEGYKEEEQEGMEK